MSDRLSGAERQMYDDAAADPYLTPEDWIEYQRAADEANYADMLAEAERAGLGSNGAGEA